MANFGLALSGLGAGIQGRGLEFQQQLDTRRKGALLQDALRIEDSLTRGDISSARELMLNRIDSINQLNGNPSDTVGLLQKLDSGDFEGALTDVSTVVQFAQAEGLLPKPATQQDRLAGLKADKLERELSGQGGESSGGAEQQFFESLLEGRTEKEKKKAIRIKLGLEGRAVSNAVLSAIASGDIDSLSDAKAQIKQAESFASATGASRSKTIDKGFDRISSIDLGLRNIDRAITAVQGGAGVGVIQKRFPSLRAASVALDNIQGLMALDVVGATTFGALSKGELDLAKDVALPTGLDTPELIKHLQDKKVAQQKLRDYFSEQIQFIDQGGTVAGFLRKKERELGDGDQSGAGQGGIPQVTTQAEFDALPSGATFTENGQEFRKP